jgi:hypothetical protein
LGPEERGFLATAIILTGFAVQFGNLGLHTSNTYELFLPGLTMLCLSGKDWEGDKATDEEGKTCARAE